MKFLKHVAIIDNSKFCAVLCSLNRDRQWRTTLLVKSHNGITCELLW